MSTPRPGRQPNRLLPNDFPMDLCPFVRFWRRLAYGPFGIRYTMGMYWYPDEGSILGSKVQTVRCKGRLP